MLRDFHDERHNEKKILRDNIPKRGALVPLARSNPVHRGSVVESIPTIRTRFEINAVDVNQGFAPIVFGLIGFVAIPIKRFIEDIF
jgi:hypothetical protein